jgi:hypothetical protein
MDFAYSTVERLKAQLSEQQSSRDTEYREALEAASERIDEWCRRRFQPYLATRVFTAECSTHIDVPDLLALTSLKHDEDEDWDYDYTWTATDYLLLPSNAVVDRQPYNRIQVRPNGAYTFPRQVEGVQVVGKWGYWEALESVGATLAEDLDASETAVDVSAGSAFDVLETLLIDSEQLYVTAINASTLTVVRAVNGTTAAPHSNGATIRRYRYPQPVVRACEIQAARLFQRAKAPFGVIGNAEFGPVRLRARIDPDVEDLLAPYKLWSPA